MNEFEMAKARKTVQVLAGLSASEAIGILHFAIELVEIEARTTVLDPSFRTEDEKNIAPFIEPILTSWADQTLNRALAGQQLQRQGNPPEGAC